MQKSYFFNSDKGDRRYNTDAWAEYFSTFIGNGVFPNPSTNLQVLAANNGYKIKVGQGKAFINGYAYVNTTDLETTVEAAHSYLNRVDLVVLRLADRKIEVYVIKGEPASDARAPQLTRGADMYELALARVNVNKGVTAISQSDIMDLRLDKTYCGLVTNIVETVDATTLYNQYASQFQNKIDTNQTDFIAWFNSVKGILNTDLGASLVTKTDAQEIKITAKQDKTDLTLTTASKTIIGAINSLDNKAASLANAVETNKSDILLLENTIASFATFGENYIKYENGVMECWAKFRITPSISSAYGSVFIASSSISFPVTFKSPPAVILNCASTGVIWAASTSNTVSSASFKFVSPLAVTDVPVEVNIFVSGRWK